VNLFERQGKKEKREGIKKRKKERERELNKEGGGGRSTLESFSPLFFSLSSFYNQLEKKRGKKERERRTVRKRGRKR
jgi:hypothetical protein